MFGAALRTARFASTRQAGMVRNASSLVVAEHNDGVLDMASRSAITAASEVSAGDVTVLVAGADADAVVAEAGKVAGVSRVLYANADATGFVAESMTPVVMSAQEQFGFSHIFAGATAVGKNVLPRVAAKLDVSMISEITGVVSEDTFSRLMYAGNAVCKVKCNDSVKVATVRGTNFEPAAAEGGAGGDAVSIDAAPDQSLCKWESQALADSDRPSLTAASRVVAGGRGLGGAEEFGILDEMADKLGAAVGASRAAVDAGYVPNEYQVGQTGKIIAPELYIAVGISGAIQHLAGMKDSKVIVAINKDAEAPIFQVSDYGLVSDLFQAVPEMNGKL